MTFDDEELLRWLEATYQFTVTITGTQIVTMELPTIYSQFFGVTYDTPNGNDPVRYGNQLLVFEGGPFVPSNASPVGSAPAAPGGGYVYPTPKTSFTSQPYVCAYSVGPFTDAGGQVSYPNIAATAFLPDGVTAQQPVQFSSATLGIQTAQGAFITWTYAFPTGINPTTNGAWIGLWNGSIVPYGYVPYCFAPIIGGQSAGLAPMSGVQLSGNTEYVAALFTSGYNTNAAQLQLTAIAAVILFTTGPPRAT